MPKTSRFFWCVSSFILFACIFLPARVGHAAPGVAWAKPTLHGPAIAQGVAVDGDGNIYRAGPDIAKYDSSGNRLWTYSINSVTFTRVAVGPDGRVYGCGTATASNKADGGFDTSYGGNTDGFVVKLSSSASVIWSTYLGGSQSDEAHGIYVDASSNVYVCGDTNSGAWVKGGADTSHNGHSDGFVIKLSSSGSHRWSSYIGGNSSDYARAVVAQNGGSIYVTGTTGSVGWTSGGFDTSYDADFDAYLVKFSASGAHTWSTYMGGGSSEEGLGVALSGSDLYVTGATFSLDGWIARLVGGRDGFVVKVTGSGQRLWSTAFGGTGAEAGKSVVIDADGNVCIGGESGTGRWGLSTTNPVSKGIFYLKFSPSGDALDLQSFGGNQIGDFAVNAAGDLFFAGWTQDADWLFESNGGTPNNLGDTNFLARINLTPPLGSLRVTLSPSPAVNAGARWRRVGTATWRASGATESSVPAGVHHIEFQDVPGYSIQNTRGVVTANNQTHLTATYQSVSGGWIDWSSYLGGTHSDDVRAIAIGVGGNIFVAGNTYSRDWGNGAITPTKIGLGDGGFVTKISAAGDHLWTTTIGSLPEIKAIGVDHLGRVRLGGDLPYHRAEWISGGFQTQYTDSDGFLLALDANGQHEWSTYLDLYTNDDIGPYGRLTVHVTGVSVDAGGQSVVVGYRDRLQAFDPDDRDNHTYTPFVVAVSPQGGHDWTRFLPNGRQPNAIARNSAGDIAITGAYDFLTLLTPDGQPRWTVSLGGNDTNGLAVTLDETGSAVVAGRPAILFGSGSAGAFVAKFTPTGQQSWFRALGGKAATAVAIHQNGTIHTAGTTLAAGWTQGGFDNIFNAPIPGSTGPVNNASDVFVAELSSSGDVNWSSYLGGAGSETAPVMVSNGRGALYVAGNTTSRGWFTGGFDSIYSDSLPFHGTIPANPREGFVSKIVVTTPDNAADPASWPLYD